MERILLLLHAENGKAFSKLELEAVTVARNLCCALDGAVWAVGLAGRDPAAAARQLAGCGAGRFLAVSGEEFSAPRYASDAAAAEALARAAGATLVLAPATSRWSRCFGGVAQRLGGRVDTHVTQLEAAGGGPQARRWYYRQRIEATLSRSHRPWFVLLDPGCAPAWSGESGDVAIETVDAELPAAARRTIVVGYQASQVGEQTIRPDASLLFVAGAGWTKKQPDGKTHVEEAARLILEFVRKTQASLGSSKSLVDLAAEGQAVLPFLTHLHQVGQTGSTPRHPKGLATCCHGEEPHVVGWRFIGERRAVNLDPNCGWARGKADVLYVADAFAVLREILAQLDAQSG
jgi:electron transfer flavoprotein alpha subunit